MLDTIKQKAMDKYDAFEAKADAAVDRVRALKHTGLALIALAILIVILAVN